MLAGGSGYVLLLETLSEHLTSSRLVLGQTVERCDRVGYVTSVSAVGPDRVTLSEVGPRHSNELTYDTGTGVLVGSVTVQQVGLAQHVTELHLVGGP